MRNIPRLSREGIAIGVSSPLVVVANVIITIVKVIWRCPCPISTFSTLQQEIHFRFLLYVHIIMETYWSLCTIKSQDGTLQYITLVHHKIMLLNYGFFHATTTISVLQITWVYDNCYNVRFWPLGGKKFSCSVGIRAHVLLVTSPLLFHLSYRATDVNSTWVNHGIVGFTHTVARIVQCSNYHLFDLPGCTITWKWSSPPPPPFPIGNTCQNT